jgi:hypothetical protein
MTAYVLRAVSQLPRVVIVFVRRWQYHTDKAFWTEQGYLFGYTKSQPTELQIENLGFSGAKQN